MAKFLTTKGVSSEIENIIRLANSKIVIVTPYIQISDLYIENLASKAKGGIKIIFICGKSQIQDIEINKLSKIKDLELFFYPNLHAKCYFNESRMIITSMNLYDFSEKNNREFGVLVDRVLDKDMFEDAYNEVKIIKDNAEQINLSKPITNKTENISWGNNSIYEQKSHIVKTEKVNFEIDMDDNGFCIRCADSIEFDIDRPYCNKCYKSWNKYQDPEYIENYCHACGMNTNSSMNKPLDKKCYKEWQNDFG